MTPSGCFGLMFEGQALQVFGYTQLILKSWGSGLALM